MMTDDKRPEALSITCPLCDWSARNDVPPDDALSAARIGYYLRRAFVAHVAREHGEEPFPLGR